MKNKVPYLCSNIKFKIVKQEIYFNEDNEDKRQSEDKIEEYDNEDYNEEIPISK